MPAFARAIGINYSGAETPTASLKSLRVYLADDDGLPVEVQPPPSPRKYWTWRGIAAWLSRADRDGTLATLLKPQLTPPERAAVQVEGRILGVPNLIRADGKMDETTSAACNAPLSSLH